MYGRVCVCVGCYRTALHVFVRKSKYLHSFEAVYDTYIGIITRFVRHLHPHLNTSCECFGGKIIVQNSCDQMRRVRFM